jgi:hypothetical protein
MPESEAGEEERALEIKAAAWLIENDVANPNTMDSRTVNIEVSRLIAQILAEFPSNVGAVKLAPILVAFAAAEVALAVAAERKVWHRWVRHSMSCTKGQSVIYDSGTRHEKQELMECSCGLDDILKRERGGR